MRRGHRICICQWRELVIRRLRSRFLGVGFPNDFESTCRNSELRGISPDIRPSGPIGRPASWGRMASGVENPRGDGESLLDLDCNGDSPNSERINVSLRSYPAPNSFVSVYNDDRPVPANDSDGENSQAALRIDEYEEEENPNEGIVPPCTSEVPSTRLSNFRFGPPVGEYPIPNAATSDPSPCRTNAEECTNDFHFGCLNGWAKDKFTLLFPDIKLVALLSGLDDIARSPYKTSGLGWGRICFVRGISVWLVPGMPGWGEPLLDFLICTSKALGVKSSTLEIRFAALRFTHLVNGNVDFSTQAHRSKALIKV